MEKTVSSAENSCCRRLFCLIGALYGAGGIASYAAANHIGGFYGNIAPILLGNAPVFLLLGLANIEARTARAAGGLIFIGSLLFVLTLLALQIIRRHLFPYAAPLGGIMMIIGWLSFIPAGLNCRR